jgi:Ti-type conjugative transfer relaxase TraA
MIAKGTPHNNGVKLAAYLTIGKENERATLWELRGFASDDIREAFRSVHVMAEGTRAEQPFFHVQVRMPDDEELAREQWEHIADRIESKLRLTDQPRAIAFHRDEDSGHEHMHIAWSRIDARTMTARPLPFYKLRLKEVSRELEIELGLTRVTSERRGPAMAPHRHEQEQARRLGTDIRQIRATLRDCWERSDSGKSFAAALADNGFTLAKGEKRDYIVIDSAGGMHALGKRILGHTAAEVRSRLADLDGRTLPTVEQARASMGFRNRAGTLDEIARVTAIEEREPAAVLRSITRNRATFTARDLEWALGKQIENQAERKQFTDLILKHSQVVRLSSETMPAPAVRYTTKTVLESEEKVLRAARDLKTNGDRHAAGERIRASILGKDKYDGITREQVRAIRHAVGGEGLALIDGQAGTGKSHAANAIREIYEADGCRVVGLAPTNAVAQDMKDSGFGRARTLHSELFSIEKGRTRWDRQTVVIVDEAAMIDTRNLARLTEHAAKAGAKLIMIGDDRQLSSIEHGGMFAVLKARHGAAELSEVRRQHTEEDRRAASLMAKGNFRDALASYAEKGGIHWTGSPSEAADALVSQWARDTAADASKTRFVFAYTNHEVGEFNRALREVRRQRGELGASVPFDTKHGPADFARHDRIQFTGTDRSRGLYNGQAGTVQSIDGAKLTVALDGRRKRVVEFDARDFRDFRHGYAGTIYKGQGRTIDQTYLFHGEYWRASASYVALTRHREKAELFVSRDTAADLAELTLQMARLDDRRAASHFRVVDRPFMRDPDQHRPIERIDWDRYTGDRDYRRIIDAQQEMQQRQAARERDRGSGLER